MFIAHRKDLAPEERNIFLSPINGLRKKQILAAGYKHFEPTALKRGQLTTDNERLTTDILRPTCFW